MSPLQKCQRNPVISDTEEICRRAPTNKKEQPARILRLRSDIHKLRNKVPSHERTRRRRELVGTSVEKTPTVTATVPQNAAQRCRSPK